MQFIMQILQHMTWYLLHDLLHSTVGWCSVCTVLYTSTLTIFRKNKNREKKMNKDRAKNRPSLLVFCTSLVLGAIL